MPPTGGEHGRPSSSSEDSPSTVVRASCVIVCDGLSWNTSPGACDVEPPVSHSGPWSTTTMSDQPSSARWRATLAPAIPAPPTTTPGAPGRSLTTSTDIRVGDGGQERLELAFERPFAHVPDVERKAE